jgi:NAD(P)-dependent dehydrogenase (short-subunit alcohol dehydrogenase family)
MLWRGIVFTALFIILFAIFFTAFFHHIFSLHYCEYVMEKLSGKTVLIVGATGGIGRETAKALKSSNAHLFIAGLNADKLRALAAELDLDEERVARFDITRFEEVEREAARIHALRGRLDILINAAGIGVIKPLENLTTEDFARSIAVNLTGAFHLLKAFLPPMKEHKKGLIINLPGVLGKTPMAGAAAYSASKYGLNGMLKSVREELKRTDIRITNIFLGGTDTPFWDSIDMRVQRDKFVVAEEAAKAIWFLCQQPASGVVSEFVLQPFNHQAI